MLNEEEFHIFLLYSLFNVDRYIDLLLILIDNILLKIDGMVYIKNNITEYLLTDQLIFCLVLYICNIKLKTYKLKTHSFILSAGWEIGETSLER